MRLCYVGSLASVHLRRWIRYFAESGHEVHVITPLDAPAVEHPGVHVHRLPSVRLGTRTLNVLANTLIAAPRILQFRALFRRIQPHLVHAHYLNDAALFALLAGLHPFVATAWGSDVLIAPQQSRAVRLGLRFIARRSDLLTCDAAHVKDALVRLGADPKRVHLAYFGTDVDRFHSGRRDPALRARLGGGDGPVVISLRRLAPIYDVATLISAAPLVVREAPGASFVVAGSGPEEAALRSLARELGVAGRVRFAGELAEEELPTYLASSDIYVSTALSDGGLAASTAEAMACGLPVVITDVADNREWVTPGESGLLVSPRDAMALAAQILHLAAHPEIRAQLGTQARRVIEQRNNWRVEMARVGVLYEALVDRSDHRA